MNPSREGRLRVGGQAEQRCELCSLKIALFAMGDTAGAKRELSAALENQPPQAEEQKIRELLTRIP
jgi:hypothetical protein